MLLISNNPYTFGGPPDFGRRTSLTSGQLGVVEVAAKRLPGPGDVHRPEKHTWNTRRQTVDAGSGTLSAGVDGELLAFKAPATIESVPLGLRLLVPPLNKGGPIPTGADSSGEGIAHVSSIPVQWVR